MSIFHHRPENPQKNNLRIIFWVLIAAYTVILPYVIILYNAIAKHFSDKVAGKVPAAIILLLGVLYAGYGLIQRRRTKHLIFIIPCILIAYAMMYHEPNPNKHIHIPEYVLMSWLLYFAISVDYQGKGIFFLIFICGSLLGVVDELVQGIHPNRYYGLSDMILNSASTLIGTLTLIGLKSKPSGDWAWTGCIKTLKGFVALVLFGAAGGVFMCVSLFDVKANRMFWGNYPIWLLTWNGLYLGLVPFVALFYRNRISKIARVPANGRGVKPKADRVTAVLWVFLPAVILFVLHALVFFVALSGKNFS